MKVGEHRTHNGCVVKLSDSMHVNTKDLWDAHVRNYLQRFLLTYKSIWVV